LQEEYMPEKEGRDLEGALPFGQGELPLFILPSSQEDPERDQHQGEEPEERPRTRSYRWILPPHLP